MVSEQSYHEEQRQLERTLKQMREILEYRSKKPRYVGNDVTEQILDEMNEKTKQELKRALNEPYFGRLNFQEEGKAEVQPYYIGKVGVMDHDSNHPIVIDWRAPLASLFYSFNGEEDRTFYEAPDGIVEGSLYLKRNVVIRQQQLLRVVDSFVKGELNLTGADEFLLHKLGDRKDHRLRDIVSTIQQEQNDIIRAPKNTAMIIQGVAGSGKTTVALHRLAYLLYHYRDQLKPERMMIFAPSTMFLDYISAVLPELGVGDIQQRTFEEWALGLLSEEVALSDPASRYYRRFEQPRGVEDGDLKCSSEDGFVTENTASRYKGSIAFKRLLDSYLTCMEEWNTPDRPFEAWENHALSVDTLRRWYEYEYRSYPLYRRKERILARIKRWVESELKAIEDRQRQKDCRKKASQRLRTWSKQWLAQSPSELYRELFLPSKRTPQPMVAVSRQIPEDVRQEMATAFKGKVLEYEDLAPLLYIQFQLFGVEQKQRFDHVVIDEAQDFSPFQVDLMKGLVRENSFTILGDLAQGIHADHGTVDWKQLQELFSEEQTTYHELKQSYRSTMEIIQFANHLLEKTKLAVSKAVPVFRSGEPVQWIHIDPGNKVSILRTWIKQMQKQGYQSMAIVTRTEKGASNIYQDLLENGLETSFIDANRQEYTGGISVIPVYLTKGLEFDAVLLWEVDEHYYRVNEQEAKLLYVGCTRALHQLWIGVGEQPSPLIR
ncbi:HelD family protein [Desmospora activa]|uniref:DNA helicase-2/ATP-dependent DNA helicase PcrA n=1 Tax=Desmospora activa DSM 45169 TaxID=1121389 RepID=A0A2T4Z1W1_9BACL|nr:UvrD-helicase domain-containing protein [Desmospora activa]PTM54738.1 DNA helicase-2/ATP-dependent DNA helicase PcrA [Desmospora activa DSM 45169]